MKIAIIIDQYDNENNGTTVSAARFVKHLRLRGHEVCIVSTGKPAPDKFVVPERNFGIFEPFIRSQGMTLAQPDKKNIKKALQDADIVHMYLPFKLSIVARKIAKQMKIPHVAAFHCQPENITYNIKMKYLTPLSYFIYFWFHNRFYRYIRHIHCPSTFIAEQLKRHGYKSKMHIISNGVDTIFKPIPIDKPEEWQDRFVILMVGRLSEEKRQDLIIRATLRSKYCDRIQLVFLGKGPRQKYYMRVSKKLPNPPIFKYIDNKNELVELYNQCNLYVHASEVEIESIACIEAISCGLIPIIADSKKSAAKQFALDERSIFKNKSIKDLCNKMEYWIEHPEEIQKSRVRYLKRASEFTIEKSIEKMEYLYNDVIREQALKRRERSDLNEHVIDMPTPFVYEVDENFSFVNRNIFFRLSSTLLFYFIVVPLLSMVSRLFFGLKISGKKNLRYLKGGAITVTNHIHYLDSPVVACTLFPRKPFFTSLKSNFEIPVIRWLIRILGGIPIPESPKSLHAFMESMRYELQKGRIVHFYPEVSLRLWHKELRPFKNGAFYLALKSNRPVLPMVFKFREPSKLISKVRKKPLITLVIGKPVYPDPMLTGSHKQRVVELRDMVQKKMHAMLSEAEEEIKNTARLAN